MNRSEIQLWINSLERLKQRFADAADEFQAWRDNKSLDVLLIHWSHHIPRVAVDDLLQYLTKDAGEDFVLRSPPSGERPSILNSTRSCGQYGASATRYLFFTMWGLARPGEVDKTNSDALDSRWDRLLRDAGTALFVGPPIVQERFRDQIANSRSDFDGSSSIRDNWEENAWLWALFDVAWSKPAGSLLRAERRLLTPDHFDIGYDRESVLDCLQIPGQSELMKRTLQSWSEKLPDLYFSKMEDVYNGSVYFLDWLIALAFNTEKKKRRGAMPRKTARDEQFVIWKKEGNDAYAIAAKWNALHPDDNVSYVAVRRAIYRKRQDK